ncbi:MAG: HTH-type transcriptional regulator CynR [Lentisphaerae bacterium ADurb.Bin242]|nr:MAG: HTH-type transcriptional regulator CynR [Lentisphaerae bacterium ADurb.Bin242]
MNVNLHHLELFYYVVKAKGISNAVRIIPYGIQQPAISLQLRKLENDIGAPLFRRKPFALTSEGEKLMKFLSHFFDNIDSRLATLRNAAAIPLRLGCPSVISSHYLPLLIRELMEKYPSLLPRIFEADGRHAVSMLTENEVDAAITFAAPSQNKSLHVVKLAKIPMALVVPAHHRFASRGFWPKSDFPGERWIAIQENTGGTLELLAGLSQFGLTPEFSVSTNSIEAALDYVEMGMGIALMALPPKAILRDRKLAVLPQEELFGSIQLSLVWPTSSSLEQNLLNFIAKTAKKLAEKII